jgi:hypothetical protein
MSLRKQNGRITPLRAFAHVRAEAEVNMRVVKYGLMAGLIVVALTAVDAAAKGNGHRGAAADVERTGVRGDVHVVFSSHDVRLIREFYAPRYRHLPPGLQKKLARTGQLPPGWQKKMQPFPVVLEHELVALPVGYHRGVIDGHAVIYRPGTSVIIDATILF